MSRLTQWHRALAAGIAAAHPITPTAAIRATGNHRVSQNDEREFSEAELLAADVQRSQHKAARFHTVNDAHALDLQVQMQGFIGGLPR